MSQRLDRRAAFAKLSARPEAMVARVVALAFALSSFACTPTLYGGPKRAADEITVIVTGADTRINSVDRTPVEGGAGARGE